MRTKVYWGLGVLLLLIISTAGVCYLVGNLSMETAEGLEAQASVKMPPLGESIATGHWEGDVWKRTVPPEPETLMHEGKTMTLCELLRFSYDSTDSWEEEVAILNRIIAEAPYSKEAYSARDTLARKDENGEFIRDKALLFERLQPLVAYHPDYPSLLSDLLMYGKDIYPEDAIRYGKEALKYMERYRMDWLYGAYPEEIHYYLGYAYQLIGDYDTALGHLDQALILYLRVRKADYLNREIREDPPPGETFATGYWGDNTWHRNVPKDSNEPALAEKMARKLPPPGEMSITGYWDGDTWHRTVPKDPETITYAGKALPLRKLYLSAFYFEKSWEEKVVILNLIIAEAPYSQEAFEARYYLARHDENGELIRDHALALERLEPLLKYYPDSSILLHALLFHSRDSHPEAAIGYGKEALKYVDMLRFDSDPFIGVWSIFISVRSITSRKYIPALSFPEYLHYHLAELYQEIGDNSTALAHLNQALTICKTVEGSRGNWKGNVIFNMERDEDEDLVKKYRHHILAGDPALGPLSTTDLAPPELPERYVVPEPASVDFE